MDSQVMISVCMITYNQQNYIKQAIESVLTQETSYAFELNIFNDASTDGTDAVIRNVIHTHPKGQLIRYHLHERNIGLSANYIYSIKHCTGKYIAICEGDDYWTDSSKLQKQADFMEQHPNYYLCFHQGLKINLATNVYEVYPQSELSHFNETDFFELVTIPMASVMLRNTTAIKFILGHSQMDFMMLSSLLTQGPAFFIKEVMSVYRVHESGATFHHFKGGYLKNRLKELEIEASLPDFSLAVRKEIGHLYVKHVLLMIEHFRNELTRNDMKRYLLKSTRIKKRPQFYLKEYKKIITAMLNPGLMNSASN
jgi:glycosyltransferase involved in cell wall biosynthesis